MPTDKLQSVQLHPPVNHWIAAFNTHDVAAIVALYTDDAELFDSGMKYPRRGRREIEQWFTVRFQRMPSITYTPTEHFFMDENQAAVTWITQGWSPRLFGQSWLARPFQVDGVSVFTLQDGRIVRQHGYYDHLSVVQQVFPPLKWLLPVRF
jgi:steroid delta-isomerase-like uncharacterized protein